MDNMQSEEFNIADDGTLNPTEIEVATTPGKLPVIQQLAIAFGILVTVFGTTYIGATRNPVAHSEPQQIPTETLTPAGTEISEDLFTDEITGKSAFVWDVREQRALFNKNADEQLPLASITKLMTALVAYELLDAEDTINISMDALKEDGDSGFVDGERFSFKELNDLTLITSSNDGAHALAAAAGNSLNIAADGAQVFVDAMNIRAEEIGLTQTYFNNMTGLDVSTTKAGAYGSARDMAFLMEYILQRHPDLVSETTAGSTRIANENGETHFAENTNAVVQEIPGLIASKTGYTDLAGGNLIVAFEAGLNRPIIIAVLGSTRNDRFSDVITLSEEARKFVLQNN